MIETDTFEGSGGQSRSLINSLVDSLIDLHGHRFRRRRPAGQRLGAGGNGTCVAHRASEGGKYNLPEGTKITVFFLGGPQEIFTSRNFVNDH
ncbi:hypothetical protein ABZ215_16690 [Amycolatopsis sp. NPDC006131]|uniref:hypothetical protein n=1 Tax=Amycolatopsis sp. NPDC006131 TaxID=3156731 RepID=UPI0033A11BAC